MEFQRFYRSFPTQIDFNSASPINAADFVAKLVQEFESKGDRILSQDGLNFSYQNPVAFLSHVRLFHDPSIKLKIERTKIKNFLTYDDAEVRDCVYSILNITAWSPLLTRLASGEAMEPYEHHTFRNSILFNTSLRHPSDPRTFLI